MEANLHFVVKIALRYQGFGLSLADLINEGNVGLLEAARRYSPKYNVRFITYAVWWVRQVIMQALANAGGPSDFHRLFESGSDRAAERGRRDVGIPRAEGLELHHLYRAMRWLGETQDAVEEALFHQRRDLFTELTLAFFDTTSLSFEGQGGETLGQYEPSKDHRPALRQIMGGAVLTGEGRPVCCELWPGTTADSRALLPVGDRLRQRFGLRNCTAWGRCR